MAIDKGRRKLLLLGGFMAAIFAVSLVALFTGHATYAEWAPWSIECLKWGGGLFASANAAEHLAGMRKS